MTVSPRHLGHLLGGPIALTGFLTGAPLASATGVMAGCVALDALLPPDTAPREEEVPEGVVRLPLLHLPVQTATMLGAVHGFVDAAGDPLAQAGWVIAYGLHGTAFGINVAHELIHRRSALERNVGGAMLALYGYGGFAVEHVRGHHVDVATDQDPSSAARDDSLWAFVPRAMALNTVRALQLEAARLARQGRPWHDLSNAVLRWHALTLALLVAIGAWLGPIGVLGFVLHGLVAVAGLEIVNYVEHYGLRRARLPSGAHERVTPAHSWTSPAPFTGMLLLHLPRHADHHARPGRAFVRLVHHDEAPRLPHGYATMFCLAFVPPLFRAVMHPALAAWDDGRAAQGSQPTRQAS